MKVWSIRVNGVPYCGEASDSEPAPPRPAGWTGKSSATRNRIVLSNELDPLRIEGNRNLRSHLDRILDRLEGLDVKTITIAAL